MTNLDSIPPSNPEDGSDPLAIAKKVADWCGEEAERCQEKASDQFRLIVWVIVIGLFLILVLPLLIGRIDLLAETELNETPANQVIESVQSAIHDLAKQIEETTTEVKKLEDSRSEIRGRLNKHSADRNDLVNQISTRFSKPFEYWEPVPLPEARIRASAVSKKGTIVLVGSVREKSRDHMILLSSLDGKTWRQKKPLDIKGEWIRGEMLDITVSRNGLFVAVGFQEKSDQVLILTSREGRNWTPVALKDSPEKKVKKIILGITVSKNGLFVAGGVESVKGPDNALILTSKDGKNWDPANVSDTDGKPIKGALAGLTVSEKGLFLAAGAIDDKKGPEKALILNSEDGKNWTPATIQNPEGKPIEGLVYSITHSTNGRFVAVGEEKVKGPDKALILTSKDGKNWSPVLLKNSDGKEIKGKITKVTASENDHFIAVGHEKIAGPDRILILTSKDGQSWKHHYPATQTGDLVPDRKDFMPTLFFLTNRDRVLLSNKNKFYSTFTIPSKDGPWEDLPTNGKWNRKPELVEDALKGILAIFNLKDGLFPEGSPELGIQSKTLLDNWQADLKEEGRISDLLRDAEKARDQQEETLRKVKEGTEGLEKAHSDLKIAQIESDKLTRAGQIATRVAIVGLLIYLVQIVVNRYRYLQKLSGFYRGRSQALQLLISLGKDSLKDINAMDLMTGLSPDSIGFDKAAEPPTQSMMNLVREGLRTKK